MAEDRTILLDALVSSGNIANIIVGLGIRGPKQVQAKPRIQELVNGVHALPAAFGRGHA